MSAGSNIKTIQALYQAFGRGNVPAIVEPLADDVKWGIRWLLEREQIRTVRHEYIVGKANVPKFFAALATSADFTRFEPQAFVADDAYVYCTIVWEATLKKTGKKLGMTGVHRFTFNQGRITEWLGTEDTALSAEMLAK